MTNKFPRLLNAVFVCKIPDEVGAVEKIEIKNGRVIVTGDSGLKMIVPTRGKEKQND